ncbi:unspecific monooxygenase [Ranunculus cassubicifolius]
MLIEILFYITIFLLGAFLSRWIFSSKTKLPPSPTKLPIIGHLHLLNNTPHQSFHKLCTRFGPLIHLRLGSVLCVVASTPELVKEFLITNGLTFASRPNLIALRLITYNGVGFGFAPYGPYWKFMKKVVTMELVNERNLAQMQYIRVDEISQLMDLLLNKASRGEEVNLSEEVSKLANNIISRMMLGIKFSGEDEQSSEIRKLARDVTAVIAQFNLADFIGFLRNIDLQGIQKKAKSIHVRYDSLLEKIMKERVHKRINDNKDFLDMLLDISEDTNAKIRLTRENIKAFMIDFLTAGTDTSGITVEWAMSELINHPTILEKAKEEIASVIGKKRLVTESDIQSLPYLQAIFKETLRLHPPIPIYERESTQDCKIGGYDIPANTILFVNNWAISRDPMYWENPLEFEPKRFMSEDGSQIDFRGQHFNLLPFGTGRRGCPGISLASQVVPTVLALLIQCFDWKIPSNDADVSPPNLVDMTELPGLTVPRAQPLVLIPSTRLIPFPTAMEL